MLDVSLEGSTPSLVEVDLLFPSAVLSFFIFDFLLQFKDLLLQPRHFFIQNLNFVNECLVITVKLTLILLFGIKLGIQTFVFSFKLVKSRLCLLEHRSELAILILSHHLTKAGLIIAIQFEFLHHVVKFTIVLLKILVLLL